MVKKKDLASVNLKNIADQDMINKLIQSSVKANIVISLQEIQDNTELYLTVLLDEFGKSSYSLGALSKFVEKYNKSKRDKQLDDKISKAVTVYMSGLKPTYKIGNTVPDALEKILPILNDQAKQVVLNNIIEKQTYFYPYARKKVLKIAVGLASDDENKIKLLTNCYKYLKGPEFIELSKSLTNGLENTVVQDILSKTKKFNVCTYEKAEIKKDAKKRLRLLKDIANTPAGVENLNFTITFGFDDIKKVAPVMRFNFLNWYYKDKFKIAARYHGRPKEAYKIIHKKIEKITLPNFTDEQINDLLFSVAFNKNDIVNKFKERYKGYRKIMSGTAMTGQEAKDCFGNIIYSWYYRV